MIFIIAVLASIVFIAGNVLAITRVFTPEYGIVKDYMYYTELVLSLSLVLFLDSLVIIGVIQGIDGLVK